MKNSFLLAGSLFAAISLAAAGSVRAAGSFDVPSGTTSTTAQTLSNNQTGTVEVTGTLSVDNATSAIAVTGTNNVINNAGTILQSGTGANSGGRAIRQMSNTGASVTITNTTSGLIEAADGDAFQMNKDGNTVINNYGRIISDNASQGGAQALDLNAVVTGTNIVNNFAGGLIQATAADAIRTGVNGVVMNSGTIQAIPVLDSGDASSSDGIDAQGNSGAQITNDGFITGRHGITGGNNDSGPTNNFTITVTNNADGTLAAINGSGINIDGTLDPATASRSTVINAGLITGTANSTLYTDGDGDGVDVDGFINLTNSGTIRALGAMGIGSDGGANSPQGVSIGGGIVNNTVTGVITSQNFSGTSGAGGILSDNSSGGNEVFTSTISNSGLIRGYTDYGIKITSTFADVITNEATGTIEGAGTGAAVQSGDGDNTVTNRGAIIGDNGNAVDLGGGNDTMIVEGGSASIVGRISGGSGTNTLTINPGAGNHFTYDDEISNFSSVAVQSGTVQFNGVSTYTGTTAITGGKLVLQGANRISSSSDLVLAGGELQMKSVGLANGQTFASINLTDDSIIDLDSTTTLTFNALGLYTDGKDLTIIGYDSGLADYAIRIEGDLLTDADFMALLGNTTVNGGTAIASFDGTYTDITNSPLTLPEPATIPLGLLGAGLLAVWQIKRARKRRV